MNLCLVETWQSEEIYASELISSEYSTFMAFLEFTTVYSKDYKKKRIRWCQSQSLIFNRHQWTGPTLKLLKEELVRRKDCYHFQTLIETIFTYVFQSSGFTSACKLKSCSQWIKSANPLWPLMDDMSSISDDAMSSHKRNYSTKLFVRHYYPIQPR